MDLIEFRPLEKANLTGESRKDALRANFLVEWILFCGKLLRVRNLSWRETIFKRSVVK